MAIDIPAWLRGLGLGQHEQAFRDNDIEPEILLRLTGDDRKDLGVISVGERRKMLDAIAVLRDAVEGAPGIVAGSRGLPRPARGLSSALQHGDRALATLQDSLIARLDRSQRVTSLLATIC